MATAKITLTLEQDEENGTNEGMVKTIALLGTLATTPAQKIVLTIACEEDDAESYRDDLRLALRARPVGITAKLKTTSEESVERERMASTTPMDSIKGFSEKYGVERVEFR